MTDKRKKYLNYTLIGTSIIVGISSLYSLIKYRKGILRLFLGKNKTDSDKIINVSEVNSKCQCNNCGCDEEKVKRLKFGTLDIIKNLNKEENYECNACESDESDNCKSDNCKSDDCESDKKKV